MTKFINKENANPNTTWELLVASGKTVLVHMMVVNSAQWLNVVNVL